MSRVIDRPGSAVGLLLKQQGAILIGRKLDGTTKGQFSTPGGWIEYGETPMVAGERELLEETGLTLVKGELAAAVHTVDHTAHRHFFTYYILVHQASGQVKNMEPHKCKEWIYANDYRQIPGPLVCSLHAIVFPQLPYELPGCEAQILWRNF